MGLKNADIFNTEYRKRLLGTDSDGNLANAKKLLLVGGYTCVLVKEDVVLTSHERGIKPLMDWLEANRPLNGFSAADCIVGRAAAFLYILLGIKSVYAKVISDGAIELLEEHGITAEYGEHAPQIRNRTGKGICPMEETVMDRKEPTEALEALQDKMRRMSIF